MPIQEVAEADQETLVSHAVETITTGSKEARVAMATKIKEGKAAAGTRIKGTGDRITKTRAGITQGGITRAITIGEEAIRSTYKTRQERVEVGKWTLHPVAEEEVAAQTMDSSNREWDTLLRVHRHRSITSSCSREISSMVALCLNRHNRL